VTNRLVRAVLVLVCLHLAIVDLNARGPWVTLQNCHYLVKRANDGDSFHVSVKGKEYIFRLYFVDAPETDAEFRDRVDEQAKYFGITAYQAVSLGQLARGYTREKLIGPFVVRTCWEDAMGRSRLERFYALVQTTTGDLGEQLVENGLARIHGIQASPEGITSSRQEWQKLETLERKAKREKVGGWGAGEGRMTERTKQSEIKAVDSFAQFFHPEADAQTAQSTSDWPFAKPSPTPVATVITTRVSTAVVAPATIATSAILGAKLDINTASEAELENISGVGPVLAGRIIAARPFKTADDLGSVKGIGDKKYGRLRSFFN
jgi:competence ComEA-like helix-hairpin-helix protein